jgi:hypothetical protein
VKFVSFFWIFNHSGFSVVGIEAGPRAPDHTCFHSWQRPGILFFSIKTTPALSPNLSPGWWVNLTTFRHLVSRLETITAVFRSTYLPSWHVETQISPLNPLQSERNSIYTCARRVCTVLQVGKPYINLYCVILYRSISKLKFCSTPWKKNNSGTHLFKVTSILKYFLPPTRAKELYTHPVDTWHSPCRYMTLYRCMVVCLTTLSVTWNRVWRICKKVVGNVSDLT